MANGNDNRQVPENGLSPENQKWLDELFDAQETFDVLAAAEQVAQKKTPTPSAITKPEEITEEPVPESPVISSPSAIADEELEQILSEDWDNITLPEESEYLPPEEEQAMPADITGEQEQSESMHSTQKDSQQKGRPKRSDSYGLWGIPHILATVIWLALIVAIGVSLGRTLWVCCADVMAFGKEPQKVTITITADDTIDSISKKLGQANLVRYPQLFKFFANVTGKADDISVGTFTLNSQLDYNAMINAMYNYGSSRGVVDIMFPEGVNCAQIFKLLEEKEVCTVAELEEYAANGELKEYWFLEGVSRGDKYCLEGYMAPDTYEFYKNDEPRRVLEKFLNEFDDRFTDKMKDDFQTIQAQHTANLRASGFSSAYISENTLTLHQVVTLASVIQKEAASDSECYDIASVFYNRLANPNILSLGADATVYYALGDYFGQIEELTAEHLAVDSPYNTRKNQGIPPGAICNMGVHALYAALEPNDTNYQYFVYDKNESAHRFAVTEREHEQNVAELMGD